ncbi:hypothetical protein, partial [Aeromonas australiensis]
KDSNELSVIVDRLSDNFEKMQLTDYEACRNNVDLAKVNIGNINKRNIYEGVLNLLSSDMGENINWSQIFSGENK